jgi:porphobilinogen synthase
VPISLKKLRQRPRRNRASEPIRRLVRETSLKPDHLILPLFVMEGKDKQIAIKSMPGQFRFSRDKIVATAKRAAKLGIPAIALFPVIDDKLKDKYAKESVNKDGLLQKTIKDLKNSVPEIAVITDVAMDPYSSDGHDGLVEHGRIINDKSVEILAKMAVAQAMAGADIVAPSDMMDGRIGAIRQALDDAGFSETGILSYAAKYASSMYGPFREALDSAPRAGDKKTYQMDPANKREAIREVLLDIAEGADIVMVKPALSYLDVIAEVRAKVKVPVAAYQVSGEYAMIKAAAERGWIDGEKVMAETLLSIHRAGADMILTYFALEMAETF